MAEKIQQNGVDDFQTTYNNLRVQASKNIEMNAIRMVCDEVINTLLTVKSLGLSEPAKKVVENKLKLYRKLRNETYYG